MNKKQKLQQLLEEIGDAIKNHKVLKLAKLVENEEKHPLHKSRNEYPDLPPFKITKADLAQIKELENFPNPLKKSQWTPFEKIFYAMLWKDGKLKSIKRIIEGIRAAFNDGTASPSKFIFVYHYFGRHLTNRFDEPLVDQHTMRACRLIWNPENKRRFTVADAEIYRAEFLKIKKAENLKTAKDLRLIDSLFFAFGKYAKR
jgi:hypothetical protein